MAKPPNTPPNSDLDGVDEDGGRTVTVANEVGQDTSDLETASRESKGRPDYSSDEGGAEDRSR